MEFKLRGFECPNCATAFDTDVPEGQDVYAPAEGQEVRCPKCGTQCLPMVYYECACGCEFISVFEPERLETGEPVLVPGKKPGPEKCPECGSLCPPLPEEEQ
ncbi:MAG: hypothetical protein WBR26_21210 [Candidatus Acidiferrum sp.]